MEENNTFWEDYQKRFAELSENDIAVFDQMGDIPEDEIIKCDVYLCILCTQGRASCTLGEKVVNIERGDVFFGHPSLFVEKAMASFDFQFVGFLLSPAYFDSIMILNGAANLHFVTLENPLIHLDEEEIKLFIANYEFLRTKLNAQRLPHYKDANRLLVQSMAYELHDIMTRKGGQCSYSYTSAESLFQRFMEMALKETPQRRDVKYYAGQLCITPKYLSAVCKQNSGQTASTILNNLTIEYVRRELRGSRRSIKEIATAAGFDNLSFFGKYVRRELGMSPREYRKMGNTTREAAQRPLASCRPS